MSDDKKKKKKPTTDDWFAGAQEEIVKDVEQDEETAKATAWNPEPGELLKGRFLKADPYWKVYDNKPNRYFRLYITDLDDDDESTVLVFASRSVLISEVLETMPGQGSLVALQYFGKMKGGAGREYHSYKMQVETQDVKYWTGVLAAAEKKRPVVRVVEQHVGPDEDPF